MTKPFSPRELVPRIHAVLRRPAVTQSMQLRRSGTLRIDFAGIDPVGDGVG